MSCEDRRIGPGARIIVYEDRIQRSGVLIGFRDTQHGPEARVRVDGEPLERDVSVFAIRPVSRARRWRSSLSNTQLTVLGILVAIVAAVPSYLALFSSHSSGADRGGVTTSKFPRRGSVVDATTGRALQKPSTNGPSERSSASIQGGSNTFSACKVSAGAPHKLCGLAASTKPLRVSPDDLVEFQVSLHNGGVDVMPYFTMMATVGQDHTRPVQLDVSLDVVWPNAHGGFNLDYAAPAVPVLRFTLPEAIRSARLAYVPGSTLLLPADGSRKVVGRLPDGILWDGIALANLGHRGRCITCIYHYARWVIFRARVVGAYD